MKDPRLVQRLLKPFANAAQSRGKTSVDMVFGGARDLTQEQHDVISDLFRLDAMGSAHFEFNSVPDALYRLVTNENLRSFQVDITADPRKGNLGHYKIQPKTKTVYAIAEPAIINDVITFIKESAEDRNPDLKRESNFEFAFFQDEISAKASFQANTRGICGWHDIENDFMFFLDQSMFDRVRERFGIKGDLTVLQSVGTPESKARKKKGAEPAAS